MISLSSIQISPADLEKRKRENALDHVRTAVNSLLMTLECQTDVASVLQTINDALTKRLVYTDVLSAEREKLILETRIINDAIEKIECAGKLSHADRRDKRKEVTK